MANPFYSAVIEVEVRHFERRGTRNAGRIAPHGEPMILRRYKYLSRSDIPHRVIPTPMPVRELHGLAAERQSQ